MTTAAGRDEERDMRYNLTYKSDLANISVGSVNNISGRRERVRCQLFAPPSTHEAVHRPTGKEGLGVDRAAN